MPSVSKMNSICSAQNHLLRPLCIYIFVLFFFTITYLSFSRSGNFRSSIGLMTVFDAILTSRQPREKLQCLYENLMTNNFRKTAVLKKI